MTSCSQKIFFYRTQAYYQHVSLCYSTKYIDIPFYYRKHYETQTTIEVTPNRIYRKYVSL